MNFLRLHWFDVGAALGCAVAVLIVVTRPTGLALLLWLSLLTLFVHQIEEYRYPGYFPGMVNSALYGSHLPDRYPLNPQTALIVNAGLGWLTYLLAAVFHAQAIWLGIATILVSVGNVVAHGALFNLKGKTLYNPGMLTALVLFLPLAVAFFVYLIQYQAASPIDWIVGVLLGAVLNFVGIMKTIDWLKDEQTPYHFPPRSLLPARPAAPA